MKGGFLMHESSSQNSKLEREYQVVVPKIKGFLCITAHSAGCKKRVENQINLVKSKSFQNNNFKNALILGGSTGYGIATSIVFSFGMKAKVIGVGFEREPSGTKTGSAGYYMIEGLQEYAKKDGLDYSFYNLDAFSDESKKLIAESIREKFGKLEFLAYSLAAPRRTDPETKQTYTSVLKPIGETYTSKTVDIYKEEVKEISLTPASDDEIQSTIKVMGGEDWFRWIKFLKDEELLAPNFRTVAYSYIGPKLTWAIYNDGTIGKAKEHLANTVKDIDNIIKDINGKSYISVNKALVTQASAAIPVVPLYLSLLYKYMKEEGTHEGCIEQMIRLYTENNLRGECALDDLGRIRIDNLELNSKIQDKILASWDKVTSDNIKEITDIEGVKKDFINLFGFDVDGVDYSKPALI